MNPSVHLNGILADLPRSELDRLMHAATPRALPSGEVLLRPGQQYSGVLFLTSGVVSVVGGFEDGQSVEIAAIGREGMLGLAPIFGIPHARLTFLVQIAGHGIHVPPGLFVQTFHASEALRKCVLRHAGRLLWEIARSASCNRFHAQSQRLARWLVVLMRKSEQSSLPLTHEFIAQMIGGPATPSQRNLPSCVASGLSITTADKLKSSTKPR